MLRRIRGVGYTVVASGQLNINPRNVPGSIPGAGRVWQFPPHLFFSPLFFPSGDDMVNHDLIVSLGRIESHGYKQTICLCFK